MSLKIGLAVRKHDGRYVVNPDYVDALRKAGADPMIVLPEARDKLEVRLHGLDGVLIPGGWDVHPQFYAEEIDGSQGMDDAIDALDMDLVQLAHAQGLPLFGICRGLQVINVALGGSLFQDIPSMISGSHDHANANHPVFITPDSRLSLVFSKEVLVNSFHHQAIKRLSPLLTSVALSDDGIIEAIEGDGIMAVQWHPERMIDEGMQFGLFQAFVAMCRK
ncbi:MAG: gamma-glutamyl-gamma-aminobutyrate hydrolase family protein [Erysipelotrichales bacterium]|nr:MAG: gamma-glutamyl-gamma-aminobutyrate hydrolase family protein [Erysipelotrichales bacterium]